MNSDTGDSLAATLGITPKQISTGLALFYVCYVLFDCPANLVMTRLNPALWMSRIVICVAIIGAAHTALSGIASFYTLRLLLGIVIAGMWPGMAYYLTLFYPPSQTGRRIGMYYTAAQLSAAVVGLVSAGFQKMNGLQGLKGWQWMFLCYGLITIVVGFALIWWLPDRPRAPDDPAPQRWWRAKPALTGDDAALHYDELRRVYNVPPWTVMDLARVAMDWRLYPLTVMYFGVVGVGIGIQSFGTLIIRSTNPALTPIQLSLLFAPIWIADLIAILIFTPLSDRFHRHRPVFFIGPCCVIISGLLVTTFAANPWARYSGLLIAGFGLGPTVPVCMAWTSEIFQGRHGEVGVAAATALVSGLGNLGSVTTTYALYTGWADDMEEGKVYRKSNLVMCGVLGLSVVSAVGMALAVRFVDGGRKRGGEVGGDAEAVGVVRKT